MKMIFRRGRGDYTFGYKDGSLLHFLVTLDLHFILPFHIYSFNVCMTWFYELYNKGLGLKVHYFFSGMMFKFKIKIFSQTNSINVKGLTYCFCLYVADPATLLAPTRVLGTLFYL